MIPLTEPKNLPTSHNREPFFNARLNQVTMSIVYGETLQLDAAIIEDNDWLRVPAIITREGVQNGGLKLFKDLAAGAASFEGAPVIFNHPAGRRAIRSDKTYPTIGFLSNVVARAKDKVLHATVNIDKSKAPADLLAAIREGRSREGSAGYISNDEHVDGVYGNKGYTFINRNIRADHYAIGVPLGACSVAAGCGLMYDAEVCTVKNPIEIDGVKYTKASDLRGWLDNDLFPKIKEVVGPEVLETILTPGANPKPVDEPMAVDTNRLEELVAENTKLKQAQIAFQKQLDDLKEAQGPAAVELKKAQDDLAAANKALKPIQDKAAADIKAQKEIHIKSILAGQKVEDTPENRKQFDGWDEPQLKVVAASMGAAPAAPAAPAAADNAARGAHLPGAVPGAQNGPAPASYVPSYEVRGKQFTVGDMSKKE